MQYKTGSVSVTFDSNVVSGVGTEWLSNISVGDLFSLKNSNILYEISSVNSDTQITLVSGYRGGSKTSEYTIHRDFTSPNALPTLSRGDINTGTIVTKMTRIIQSLFLSYSDFTYQGEWVAGSYVKGDVVLHNKKLYIATESTSTQPPSNYWDVLFDGINMIYVDTVEELGTANAGSLTAPSRVDHVHKMPTVEDVGVLSDSSTTEDLPESGDNRYYTFQREDDLIQALLTTHFS